MTESEQHEDGQGPLPGPSPSNTDSSQREVERRRLAERLGVPKDSTSGEDLAVSVPAGPLPGFCQEPGLLY